LNDYRAVIGQTDAADSRWHLGVAAYEPIGKVANVRLYMDGRLEAEAKVPAPLRRDDSPICLGGIIKEKYDATFSGWIDEVAIFTRAILPNEVAAMYTAGNPAGPVERKPDKKQVGGWPGLRPQIAPKEKGGYRVSTLALRQNKLFIFVGRVFQLVQFFGTS